MKKINLLALLVLVMSSIAAGGYWLGSHRVQDSGSGIQDRGSKIQDSGMKTKGQAERKILYYRNPMGLADTSPVPKKDAMGMDYVAVYEGEAEPGNSAVSISYDRVQKLGVKSEAAALRVLRRTLRLAARIEVDERRIHSISPKFEGWVERLYVNSTGQTVVKGQPLLDVYSPELVSAQREYVIAKRAATDLTDSDAKQGMEQLADASLIRLKNWDMGDNKSLKSDKRSLTYASPISGIVLDKKALQGMRFMPGEALYQIADLSSVWVVADAAEQDIGQIDVGSTAQVVLTAYPGQIFTGKIDFIYPVLNTATRTVQVRVELSNPKGLLKPGMFAKLALATGNDSQVLSIPASAVIDSGTRQVALVRLADGRFEPRSVKLGARGDDYVEVLAGIAEGEQVVTSANFLIDAESNLKAALDGLGKNAAQVLQQSAASGNKRTPLPKASAVGHQGLGILNAINADGTVSISFEAIKTLGMPGMTMDFRLANASLATGIKPGSAIAFELVERAPDNWLITRMQVRHEEH